MIVRELFALLGLKVDEQSFAKGQLAVEVIKAGAAKLYETVKGVADTFVEMVKGTAEAGNQILDLAEQTGVSAEALQRMGAAAKLEGLGVGDLAFSLRFLLRSMKAAKDGADEQATAFKKLGVEVTDGRKHLRAVDAVFADVIAKYSVMPESAEKAALGFAIFGRAGGDMINVANNGTAALDAMRNAHVMTAEQLEAGKGLTKALQRMGQSTKALWREAILPLLPSITDLVKRFEAWRKENAAVIKGAIQKSLKVMLGILKAIGVVFSALVKVGKVLADNWKILAAIAVGVLGAALIANLAQLKALGVEFLILKAKAIGAAIASAAAWVLAALPFVAIALAIAAVALALEDLYQWATGGKSVFGALYEEFDKFLRRWTTTPSDWWIVQKIKDAMSWMYKINDQMQAGIRSIRDNWDALGDHIVASIRRAAEALVNSPIGRIAGAVTGVQIPGATAPTTAPPAAGAVANYATALGGIHTVVQVQQAQGASAQETGQTVAQMVDAANRRMLREAAGAIPGG